MKTNGCWFIFGFPNCRQFACVALAFCVFIYFVFCRIVFFRLHSICHIEVDLLLLSLHVSRSLWLSVYVLGTLVSPAKIAEPIAMLLGGADLLEPRELCIRWECILAPSGEYDWMICVVWHYVTLLWPLVDCCEFGCWYSAFDCFRTLISEMICCVVYWVGRWPLLTRSFTHFSLLLCIFAS